MFLHLFPYGVVNKGCTVAIYGAGDVGMDYYYQLKESRYCEISCWVDKNYIHYQSKRFPVDNPECLKEAVFDTVVIAISDVQVSRKVREYLLGMGISEEKIVWGGELPRDFTPNSYIRYEMDQEKNFDNQIKQMVATEILDSDRLDIIIRYLFAKDIVNRVDSSRHQSLYTRFILTGIGAEEPMTSKNRMQDLADYDEKVGVDTFVRSFSELVESMRMSGFSKEKYIPLNKHGAILNGSHRLATALALEEQIWVKYIQEDRISGVWNWDRLERDGFSDEDKIDILRGFSDLYSSCNLLVMFGGVENLWDFIERKVIGNAKRVGGITIDLENDYISFENIIRELYYEKPNREEIIRQMLMNKLSIRVVLFTDEKVVGKDVYDDRTVEDIVRVMGLSEYDVLLPRCNSEYRHIKSVLLSNNNLKKESMQIRCCSGATFENKLFELKKCLDEQDASIDDICLTDEAVMAVFGLRDANEIGVMLPKNYREISVPQGFIVKTGYEGAFIHDDNYHFVFRGVKIINPEIVENAIIQRLNDLRVRAKSETELMGSYKESKRDYRLLQILFDYYNNFNNKKALKERFDFEIRRQWAKNSYFE